MRHRIYIDDTPIADTSAAAYAGMPVVIDGARVTSGRDNPLDQPDPSTAAVTIRAMDDSAARTLLGRLRPYAQLRIDTTLERRYQQPRFYPTQHVRTRTRDLGRVIVAIEPTQVFLSPAPWQEWGANPTAWDELNPAYDAGTQFLAALPLARPPYADTSSASLVAIPAPWLPTSTGTIPSIPARPDASGRFVARGPLPATGHPVLMLQLVPPTWNRLAGRTWRQAGETWLAAGTYRLGASMQLGPTGAATTTTTVFTGEITRWEARRETGATVIELDAVDILGKLARTVIGDVPRPRETVSQRIQWALQTAGVAAEVTTTATRDPLLEVLDVDRRAALEVIHDAATSAALSVWPTTDAKGRPTLLLEDADARPATDSLTVEEDGTTTVTTISETQLDPALISRPEVTITRESTVTPTQVRIGWEIVTTDENGRQDRTEMATSTGTPGGALITLTTQLVDESSAIETGAAYLRRAPADGWKLSGVTIKTSRHGDLTPLAKLIGATSRAALPVALAGIPQWVPAAPVERFTVEGVVMRAYQGHWEIETTLSRPNHVGHSLTWAELPQRLTWESSTLTWAQTAGLIIRKD